MAPFKLDILVGAAGQKFSSPVFSTTDMKHSDN